VIYKLHNLKKMQLDQELVAKQALVAQGFDCDNKIQELQQELNTTGVKAFGSIGDFKVLAIHKDSIKFEQNQIKNQKRLIEQKIQIHNQKIVELNKELEQYKYLIEVDKKEKRKQEEKNEELAASEFVQARWGANL